MLSGFTNLVLTKSSLSLGMEDVYSVSFVGGKLHILRKTFELRREIKHRFVPQKYMCPCCRRSRVYSGPYYGYALTQLPRP